MTETQAQYKARVRGYLKGREPLLLDIAAYYAGHDLLHFAQLEAARAVAERQWVVGAATEPAPR